MTEVSLYNTVDFIPKLRCYIDFVCIFDDLDVFTGADLGAAASTAEHHLRWFLVLHAFLFLLYLLNLLLH